MPIALNLFTVGDRLQVVAKRLHRLPTESNLSSKTWCKSVSLTVKRFTCSWFAVNLSRFELISVAHLQRVCLQQETRLSWMPTGCILVKYATTSVCVEEFWISLSDLRGSRLCEWLQTWSSSCSRCGLQPLLHYFSR